MCDLVVQLLLFRGRVFRIVEAPGKIGVKRNLFA